MNQSGRRIYLDFDGVINALNPDALSGEFLGISDAFIPEKRASWLRELIGLPGVEIVWATHREEGIYQYSETLGLPRLPYLTFTDPTGSKTKDLIAHYQKYPCAQGEVHDDSLTTAERKALTAAGLSVVEYMNTQLIASHT